MLAFLSKIVLGEIVSEDLPCPVPPHVRIRRGRLIPRVGGLLGRFGGAAAAVTLRSTIVVGRQVRLTPSLIAHELAHVRQWERVPFFPIRYALANLRHGYHNNPYEVEARAAARATATPREDEA